jgi:hypothetical protein
MRSLDLRRRHKERLLLRPWVWCEVPAFIAKMKNLIYMSYDTMPC